MSDEDEEWPADTVAAVFVRCAVDRVGKIMFPNEWTGGEQDNVTDEQAPMPERLRRVLDVMVPAIERRELLIKARLIDGSTGNRFQAVPAETWTPEDWRFVLLHPREVELVVERGLLPVRQRRPIAVPHWLFVQGEGLERLCGAMTQPVEAASVVLTAARLSPSMKELPRPEQQPALSTGLAGRPTSAHLCVAEAKRRISVGVALPTLSAEAAHLAAWVATEYPKAPRVGTKALRNNQEFQAVHAAFRSASERPK